MMIGFIAVLVALAVRAAPTDSNALAQVQELIRQKGAKEAVALFKDDRRWDVIMNGIATGRQEWLEIAVQLRQVSDGGASETLDMAIEEALPQNPDAILRLVAKGAVYIRHACGNYGFGQIEDERPKGVILSLVDKRIAAVTKVKNPALEEVRGQCLVELKALRDGLDKKLAE